MRLHQPQVDLEDVIEPDGDGVAIDPVCGDPLLVDDAGTIRVEHRGKAFHFCSDGCRDRFLRLAERIRLEEVLKMGALFAPGEKARWGVA